jgi:hypothetical protein
MMIMGYGASAGNQSINQSINQVHSKSHMQSQSTLTWAGDKSRVKKKNEREGGKTWNTITITITKLKPEEAGGRIN